MAAARFNYKCLFWDKRARSQWWSLTLPQFSFLIWLFGFRQIVLIGIFAVQATRFDQERERADGSFRMWELDTIAFWNIPTTYMMIAILAVSLGGLSILHAYQSRAYGRVKFLLTSLIIIYLMWANISLILLASDFGRLAAHFGLAL